jgi:hypothetical protein
MYTFIQAISCIFVPTESLPHIPQTQREGGQIQVQVATHPATLRPATLRPALRESNVLGHAGEDEPIRELQPCAQRQWQRQCALREEGRRGGAEAEELAEDVVVVVVVVVVV